ncbi:hypothetical protein SLEP1_g22327 [Rubroshorea leprosula]|uniref:Uncharacterized protein n=1 Tax=Rubroshorea leprosula TaxID=152421 RepID=A0AAV5JI40_9ROSI|nr:hypothetical protein SLEP1_g22327 [Rubroshorea leprosula]
MGRRIYLCRKRTAQRGGCRIWLQKRGSTERGGAGCCRLEGCKRREAESTRCRVGCRRARGR